MCEEKNTVNIDSNANMFVLAVSLRKNARSIFDGTFDGLFTNI